MKNLKISAHASKPTTSRDVKSALIVGAALSPVTLGMSLAAAGLVVVNASNCKKVTKKPS